MIRIFTVATVLFLLGACSQRASEVRVTHNGPAPIQTASRTEPVFYNGKTYQLEYSYAAASGGFDARVSGMKQTQQADAVGLATSAIGHFACPSAKANLVGAPSYVSGVWAVPARCA